MQACSGAAGVIQQLQWCGYADPGEASVKGDDPPDNWPTQSNSKPMLAQAMQRCRCQVRQRGNGASEVRQLLGSGAMVQVQCGNCWAVRQWCKCSVATVGHVATVGQWGSWGNGAVGQWCKCSAATLGQWGNGASSVAIVGQWGNGASSVAIVGQWGQWGSEAMVGVLLQLWWPSGGRCSNACRGKAAPAVVQTGQCCRCGDLGAAGAAAQWGRGEE
eukprot:1146263-Pelagomonas_calceolata.AAC.4